jgi:energy-coupling factor transport system ATP-binding protein
MNLEPILQVKDLSYVYSAGTPFEHKALDNVNFTLNRGEFVGIIGHTGSGKSTLMQQLNGLLKPTSGQVLLGGVDIWSDKQFTRQARFRVGLVFQYPEYQLFEETVYKDIAFGPKNMGLSEAEIDKRVREAAGFVGITQRQLQVSPFDLSGGQKRRVAIAGVIAMEPEVLILDEPVAGLDPIGRAEILENIEAYRKAKNATILMVSHSMEDVANMTDRLLVLYGSHLVMDDAPANVFVHAQELVDMGLNIPRVTQIFLDLRKKGLDVPNVYTIEQAVDTLIRLKEGNARA